jgi:hypothetical protein
MIEQSMWQEFVGIYHNLNAIIVAIRGTQENRFCNNCRILLAILSFPLSCKHKMSLYSDKLLLCKITLLKT